MKMQGFITVAFDTAFFVEVDTLLSVTGDIGALGVVFFSNSNGSLVVDAVCVVIAVKIKALCLALNGVSRGHLRNH